MTKSRGIMKKHHNVRRVEKFEALRKFIAREKIEELLGKNHYSFGMVRDMLLRDVATIKGDPIVGEYIQNLQSFRNVLKSAGLSFDLNKYNEKPQWWKVQYRYPEDYTTEQIQECIRKTSIAGQVKTVALRKTNGTYASQEFRREWSPLTMEFYTKKGWTKTAAQKRIKEICSNGARGALTKTQSPTTEERVSGLLEDAGMPYSQQFAIMNEGKEDNRRRFIYDFLLPDKKAVIEVNGDFWHANPLMYRSDDIMPYPAGRISAKEVWERDKRKLDYAKQKGYNVVVIWEFDLNHNIEKVLEVLQNV